jgi:hypothetical protein
MAISTISLGKVKFNWRGTWAVTTAYVKDDVFSYGANAYIVTTSHVSTTSFADNLANVSIMVQGVENAGVYDAGTLYKVNDIVTYGGAVYIAKQSSTGQSPSNTAYWTSLVGGFQYLSTYNGSTTYKKGDIVTYGGNNYIATTDTINNVPTNTSYWTLFTQGMDFQNIYSNSVAYKVGQVVSYGANSYIAKQDTTAGIVPTNAAYWVQLTTGQIGTGVYSDSTVYKQGDLVQYGGYTYVNILASTGTSPNNTTNWTQVQTGFIWSGTYNSGTTYQKGEVVNYNGSSFVSITFNNFNHQPDTSAPYWSLMMQGSANNVYTTAGDIAYRNNSAIVRLPVGTSGQVLTIDNTSGLPIWEANGVANNVYYVSQNGVDAANYGSTVERPFASLQYATQHVVTPCTIFVKAGNYYETLPITVPASCAIVGDSLRNTFINPKPNIVATSTVTSSNVTNTNPTYSNGTSSYAATRTLILSNLNSIQSGVINYLGVTYTGFSYNATKCKRDIGLILNAVLTDLVFGSNYASTKAGLSYLRSYSSVVTSSQKAQTIAGINKARDLALAFVSDSGAITAITANFAIVTNLINTGVSAFSASALTYPDPSNITTAMQRARALLVANRSFIQAEIVAWIAANYTVSSFPSYDTNVVSRDIGYMLDAITYDMTYDGNSQILDFAAGYYIDGTNLSTNTVTAVAAYGRLKTIIQQIVLAQTVSKSVGNAASQTILTASDSTNSTRVAGLVDNLVTVQQTGIIITASSVSGTIVTGMVITGTGFSYGQTVTAVNGTSISISAPADIPISGTISYTTYALSVDAGPVPNNLSTMFLLSDSCLIKQMTFKGMTGFSPSTIDAQDITTATIGGVFMRLNPASPIINKSPYITDCSAFSTGGVGVIVDGSIHNTGNKSMVFHAYTNIHDNGVGFWMKDNAKAEIVSCFTYFCVFGYATSGGAKIRSLNGNNSYGTYGVVSRGYDTTETPITGTVYGNQITYNSNSLSGNGFSTSDTITGLTSGARATITNVQSGSYKIYYKSISGTFTSGETITGSVTGTSAVIASGGNSGQKGFVIVATGLSAYPIIGTSIEFTGDTSAYVIQQVSTWINSSSIVQIVLAQEKVNASIDGTALRIRANFSNARLTGHDFLSIGTGGVTTTNYPGYPLQSAAPGNQTVEVFPGRVFYVATDQDGNFKVGNYFAVNQATGTATLNANAFNLSGLSALRLGSVGAQLGELISEFSSDVTLGADSNSKVPTQHAVKTYVDTKVANSFPSYLKVGTSPTTTVAITDATGANPGTGANTDLILLSIAGVQIGQFNNTKFTYTPGGNTAFEAAQSYVRIPSGPTSGVNGRPGSPSNGYIRYNTDLGAFEGYVNGQWTGIGGGNPWATKTTSYTAVSNDRLFIDTSSAAVTITLPASPTAGDNVRFMDLAGTFGTNNLTVARNGNKIYNQTQDLVINTNDAAFQLIYTGATYGWKLAEL